MAIERLAFSDIGGNGDFLDALGVPQLLHLQLPVEDDELVASVLL